jgi:hypothetical protein
VDEASVPVAAGRYHLEDQIRVQPAERGEGDQEEEEDNRRALGSWPWG